MHVVFRAGCIAVLYPSSCSSEQFHPLTFQNLHTFVFWSVQPGILVPFLLAILPVYNFHCPVDYLSDLRDRCMYMDNRRTILLAL